MQPLFVRLNKQKNKQKGIIGPKNKNERDEVSREIASYKIDLL